MNERQNLYLIQFDHQDYYVEAPSMGCACLLYTSDAADE